MRIRQVRPEYWSDETVARLADPVRLFYIGLWGVADDAGWLEWRPARIGALLYPYRAAKRRETDIEAWGDVLSDTGRLRVYRCGCGLVPTLPRHQRITGKQSFQYRDAHAAKHGQTVPVAPSGYRPLIESPVTEGNGRERNVVRETDIDSHEPRLKVVDGKWVAEA